MTRAIPSHTSSTCPPAAGARRRPGRAAVDAERQRIERELHDGLQQHLVALGMALDRARRTRDPERPASCSRRHTRTPNAPSTTCGTWPGGQPPGPGDPALPRLLSAQGRPESHSGGACGCGRSITPTRPTDGEKTPQRVNTSVEMLRGPTLMVA
ncbi:histidine kinase dimerization/phosphoacceptor domain-containing protein [Micromonospora sp. C81]|uniref:histidine kinase dimerization/phosphoacceptor domain-containing protein n=1 Tax=Micromonospora sp. C81 TaxID=2824881 RepID=UPI0027E01D01|nr:histidine kinase dimerization/phosphoacceptor domain-containing protein [Micromonospora sp. C81]